jgi:hypothetical protein
LLSCFLLAISDDALAGWAASTHYVYTIVRGCFVSICMVGYLVAHVSHVSALFLDRFRDGLKGMDYWKLLRVQLEHQSLLSLHACILWVFLLPCF